MQNKYTEDLHEIQLDAKQNQGKKNILILY